MAEKSFDMTELIHRAREGDAAAADRLFDTVYGELRRLARARLRVAAPNPLLDTTSLVHELYLRFVDGGRLRLADRVHFMRWAGRVMRSIIVDAIRATRAARRGGASPHVTFTTRIGGGALSGGDEILQVHQALDELARHDPRMAQVVEMKYFGGMTEAEAAEALGVTDRTVRRDWEKARLWLRDALR